jgi:hypothetical protein
MDVVKREIEQLLAGATVGTADGASFPLLDLLSVGYALPVGFSSLLSAPLSRKQRLFVERAAKASDAFARERIDAAVRWLGVEVMLPLLAHSRMDGRLVGCLLESRRSRPPEPLWQLTLQSSQPRVIRVEIDGQRRRAYQCAVPWLFEGIRWVECDGAALGLDGGQRYPVFLQAHALHRLRERLAVSVITELAVHHGLICSLAEPRVAGRQGDSYLLEFHVRGTRVGYLPARLVEGRLVITTFLFLTMAGTPEHGLLKEKLRLTRRDIEYEGLDRLETFLTADVLADQELVRVLEECGCGSLLALARDGFPHTAAGGHAEDLRRFLGIGEGGDQKLFKRLGAPPPRTA